MQGQLHCACCGEYQATDQLLDAIHDLEYDLGHQITVTSLYRCEKHNAEVGGSPNSFHLKGMAVDILCAKPDQPELIQKLKNAGFGGIGVGFGFVHGDVGPVRPAWGYGVDGRPKALP